MKELTDRQRAVLRFIADHIEANGYPPTVREIAAAFDIASTNAVTDHLIALERKGAIERRDLVSRGLRLTEEGRAAVGAGVKSPVATALRRLALGRAQLRVV